MTQPKNAPQPTPKEAAPPENQAPQMPVTPPPLPVQANQAATPAATPAITQDAPAGVMPPAGRRYGFLCQYCSSRLEATESMGAQQGTCPTCGNTIIIPILDHRGRLIDPTTNEIIRQDPHPVHAYAAAGNRAPQIIADPATPEERVILCPRCKHTNPISANNCESCGLPFTMEGTIGDAVNGTNTWAVASLVLGIVSMAGGCAFVGVPPILAIIFGIVALRSMSRSGGTQAGHGLAVSGIIMGVIGLMLFGLLLAMILK